MQIIILINNQRVTKSVVEMWYTKHIKKLLQYCINLHNRKDLVKFPHSFPNY